MRLDVVVAAFIVLAATGSAVNAGGQVGASGSGAVTAYDDFIKLSADQRRHRFDAISPENKAMIVRTHADRWLQGNRGRLSDSETAVFEEIIAFFTPDLYRTPPDAASQSRQESLQAKMRCRVSPEDVHEATSVLRETKTPMPPRPTWTYLNKGACWINWVLEGVVDNIPDATSCTAA